VVALRGKPEQIRTDNCQDFIGYRLQQWLAKRSIRIQYIQPGKPMQNGFIERKNGSLRRELLNVYLSDCLNKVRAMVEM
jgi:putative transposase